MSTVALAYIYIARVGLTHEEEEEELDSERATVAIFSLRQRQEQWLQIPKLARWRLSAKATGSVGTC